MACSSCSGSSTSSNNCNNCTNCDTGQCGVNLIDPTDTQCTNLGSDTGFCGDSNTCDDLKNNNELWNNVKDDIEKEIFCFNPCNKL